MRFVFWAGSGTVTPTRIYQERSLIAPSRILSLVTGRTEQLSRDLESRVRTPVLEHQRTRFQAHRRDRRRRAIPFASCDWLLTERSRSAILKLATICKWLSLALATKPQAAFGRSLSALNHERDEREAIRSSFLNPRTCDPENAYYWAVLGPQFGISSAWLDPRPAVAERHCHFCQFEARPDFPILDWITPSSGASQ